MPAGRPPVPTKLKILRGNPGKRRLNDQEPQPAETTAVAPDGLSGEALAYWTRHAPELVRIGVLTIVDRDEFALCCRLRAKGLELLEDDTDLALKALRQSSAIGSRYGIGASDRVKIKVSVAPKPKSKWAGLLGDKQA